MKPTVLRHRLAFLSLCLCLLFLDSVAAAAQRPNLIFVLCDDLAQGDLGCYGQKLIKTPHLDRMAQEGTRFTQAYCGTSVCAPSRASLMTGLHCGHCPIRANWEIAPGEGQLPLPAGTITVAQILHDAGYATACFGKWGMGMFDTTGSPLKKGFEHFLGYNCQRHAHSYFPTYLYRDAQRFDLPGNDGKGVGRTYAQELIQRGAEQWLHANHDRPFFMFYAITLPHGRHEIDDLGQYADTDWTPQQKAYAAQVSRLDADVGRILALLKELDLDEKTLVMVSGDNGSSFNENSELGRRFDQSMGGKLRGFKRSLYEGGLRQAALARWPGVVPATRVCDDPWAFWDFLPTAVELAGAKLPDGFEPDGLSLTAMLKGGPAPQRDSFYWELHEGPFLQAVRFGDWKAVRNGPAKAIELYHLRTDEAEKSDVAGGHADLVAQAERLMKAAHRDDPNWPIFANQGQRNAWRKSRAAAAQTSAETPDRPNVIVILADDLGYGDLACYGHPKFKTPSLDRMAAEGARLTHFNTPMPFCAPTRASLLTGRYPFRCGMNGNPAPDGGPAADLVALRESEVTLAQLFHDAGYATGMVGKWHLGHKRPEQMPTGRGFDEYLGILYSNDMRPVRLMDGSKPIEYPIAQTTLTRRYTARALDFIERHRSKPFFFYFAHAMPHKPLAPAEKFYKQSGAGLYGDVLLDLDTSVGEVLAKLKELDLDQRTLVIFTSDNGPWFGGSSGGLRGMKGSSYEGGYRVPCIARWPGKIPAGRVDAAPAVMMDLFATVLAAAKIAPPLDRVIDGRDIMPLFAGNAASPHEAVFGQQGPRLATIRDARWKLHVLAPRDNFAGLSKSGRPWTDPRGPDGVTILAPNEQYPPSAYPGKITGEPSRPMQLFDLQSDPSEQTDVAAEHPDVVARLKALYDEMLPDAG